MLASAALCVLWPSSFAAYLELAFAFLRLSPPIGCVTTTRRRKRTLRIRRGAGRARHDECDTRRCIMNRSTHWILAAALGLSSGALGAATLKTELQNVYNGGF